MRRDLSGDHVFALPRWYLKVGSADVGRQGLVMRRANELVDGIAPKVVKFGKHWHLTERLWGQSSKLNCSRVTHMLIERLIPIWDTNEQDLYDLSFGIKYLPFSVEALVDYLQKQGACWLFGMFPNVVTRLQSYKHATEATHGDCTFENALLDFTKPNPICLIDWMPYRREYLPAHRDVDYGKIMQGLLGWRLDNFKHDRENLSMVSSILQERPMAGFWACIHYERIKARSTDTMVDKVCDTNIEIIFRLTKEQGHGTYR